MFIKIKGLTLLYQSYVSKLRSLSDLNTMRTESTKNASEVRTLASDFRTPLEKVSTTSKFLTTCNRT
jgi:hypothetical protein